MPKVQISLPGHSVAGQLGLKTSRPLSQVGSGSTRPESTQPGVFRAISYIQLFVAVFLGSTSTGRMFMVFVVLCPGTPKGSTGSGSGFKGSQKTG